MQSRASDLEADKVEVRTGSRHRYLLAFVVAAVLIIGFGSWLVKLRSGAVDVSEADANGPLAAAECPPMVDAQRKPFPSKREGRLVPSGATEAILCTYGYTLDAQQFPLDNTKRSIASPESVSDWLNALSDVPENASCNAMATNKYRIVLGYVDHQPVVIDADLNCGIVEQGGVIRRISKPKDLLNQWGG